MCNEKRVKFKPTKLVVPIKKYVAEDLTKIRRANRQIKQLRRIMDAATTEYRSVDRAEAEIHVCQWTQKTLPLTLCYIKNVMYSNPKHFSKLYWFLPESMLIKIENAKPQMENELIEANPELAEKWSDYVKTYGMAEVLKFAVYMKYQYGIDVRNADECRSLLGARSDYNA
jgi:hypothetical protein